MKNIFFKISLPNLLNLTIILIQKISKNKILKVENEIITSFEIKE